MKNPFPFTHCLLTCICMVYDLCTYFTTRIFLSQEILYFVNFGHIENLSIMLKRTLHIHSMSYFVDTFANCASIAHNNSPNLNKGVHHKGWSSTCDLLVGVTNVHSDVFKTSVQKPGLIRLSIFFALRLDSQINSLYGESGPLFHFDRIYLSSLFKGFFFRY